MNDLMTKSFLNYVDLEKQIQSDQETELSDAETWQQLNLNPIDQENLSVFFKLVDSIKSQMEEINNLLHDLESLHLDSKITHSTKLLRGFRDRMDADTITILRKVKLLKTRLESLDKSNLENQRKSITFGELTTVDRTRVEVTNGLRIKFKDMISDFTGIREKIINDHKDDYRRKYFRATGEEPSEEIVEKLMSGSLKMEVLEGKTNKEEKERYEVVKDIQRSLNKLHQVFLDMAVLIEKQGEEINDIEKNMVNAGEFINGGTNNLYYAKQMMKKKKKNRAWVYWVWAVGIIILLVCLISLL